MRPLGQSSQLSIFLLVQSVKTGGEKLSVGSFFFGFHCYVPSVKVLVKMVFNRTGAVFAKLPEILLDLTDDILQCELFKFGNLGV